MQIFSGAESWEHTEGCVPSAAAVQAARTASGADTKLSREQWEHLATLVKNGASVNVIKYVDTCLCDKGRIRFSVAIVTGDSPTPPPPTPGASFIAFCPPRLLCARRWWETCGSE